MDDTELNTAIVAAKRRAKAHSKQTGESYQRSLEHVARLCGHEDWASFLKTPEPPEKPVPGWITSVRNARIRSPRMFDAGVLSYFLTSMIVMVLLASEHGEHGSGSPIHVPHWICVPFGATWIAIVTLGLGAAIADTIVIIRRMRRDFITSREAGFVVGMIGVILYAIVVWTGLRDGPTSQACVMLVLSFAMMGLSFWTERTSRRNEVERM